MEPIYLDNNSTTPVLPEVVEAMRPFWAESFGNPASAHRVGRRARQALETAREHVADLLAAHPDEVVFTSGATEANNLALFGAPCPPTSRIIASPIEHPSVAEPVAELARQGHPVDFLPVDATGIVHAEALHGLLRPDLSLVTVMVANNETGAVQPVAELTQVLSQSPVRSPEALLFHCDAVQAVGKVPVRFHDLGVDTLSLSAHKFHGPRGVGALLVRRGVSLRPIIRGGHQQQGRRPGTEPVVLAVGLAKALELACAEMNQRRAKVSLLRQQLLEALTRTASPLVLNGPITGGLPHTVNVSFPGCPADLLLMKLDLVGVMCSTGSACSSGSLQPSPVLRAMGCFPEVLNSSIRVSLSHLTTPTEIEAASQRISFVVKELRQIA